MTELAFDEQSVELSSSEVARLARLEIVIEDGLGTFVKVGEALMEIRDKRFYRDGFDTFEDYCRERWQMSRDFAYKQIRAAEVVRPLVDHGLQLPANERQARELAPLLDAPEKLQEAWAEVVEMHPQPTASDVREVVQSKMDVHYSSATDLWSTPQDLFDELNEEFRFDVDVCATEENAKCDRYFTAADDGLAQDWTGTCWMNPPYGDVIKEWVAKARAAAGHGCTVVCLVPARVDTGWWWDHCRYGEIRFLRGRLKFGGGATGAPFPSAVVVFGPNHPEGVAWWERS